MERAGAGMVRGSGGILYRRGTYDRHVLGLLLPLRIGCASLPVVGYRAGGLWRGWGPATRLALAEGPRVLVRPRPRGGHYRGTPWCDRGTPPHARWSHRPLTDADLCAAVCPARAPHRLHRRERRIYVQ